MVIIIEITVKVREKEFIEENKTLCQEDCVLSDYNYTTKKVNCSCDVEETPLSFADMNIDKTKLYRNFVDINNIANVKILFCYKNLFNKNGIMYNIGSYILLANILFHIISFFIF